MARGLSSSASRPGKHARGFSLRTRPVRSFPQTSRVTVKTCVLHVDVTLGVIGSVSPDHRCQDLCVEVYDGPTGGEDACWRGPYCGPASIYVAFGTACSIVFNLPGEIDLTAARNGFFGRSAASDHALISGRPQAGRAPHSGALLVLRFAPPDAGAVADPGRLEYDQCRLYVCSSFFGSSAVNMAGRDRTVWPEGLIVVSLTWPGIGAARKGSA